MQEVILYRNPLEAAFWQTINENPEYVIYFLVFAVVFIFAVKLFDWAKKKV